MIFWFLTKKLIGNWTDKKEKKSSIQEKDNFIEHLHSLFAEINVNEEISKCENVNCKDPKHIQATDDLIVNVLDAIDTSATENLHNVF